MLSIVAGARLQSLTSGLEHEAVVRSMPNTPARVGEGITVWTASAAVNDDQRQQARTMLAALGQEIFVEDENYLDMATALSGTGPSYVYLFMEAMVDAGVHLGFPAPHRRAAGGADRSRGRSPTMNIRLATWPGCATR